MRRHRRVHHLGPDLLRCHVEVQVTRVMALAAQGSRRALAQLIADVGQHHFRALAHEQLRRRAAEAHQLAPDRSRRAGQQRYFFWSRILSSPLHRRSAGGAQSAYGAHPILDGGTWSGGRTEPMLTACDHESDTDRFDHPLLQPRHRLGDRMAPILRGGRHPPRLSKAVYCDLVLESYRASYFRQQHHKI